MSAQLDAALYFDVEDYFHPPEMGSDDIIREFAEALDAEGLRGNFLFIAERARLLKERGRRDVIDSLARHAIGLHTLTGEHPCLPEYVAGKDWEAGVAITREYESKGWEILRHVFGRDPVCLSQHAQYGAPHVFPVAREFGVPHAYGYPAAPPLFGLSWYCGALNIPYVNPGSLGADLLSYFEVGDENYADEARFASVLPRLEKRIADCLAADHPYLTIFICHPYHLRYVEFTDYWQYINGTNIPREQWGVKNGGPRRRTDAQMEVAWRNVRRLLNYLRRHDALKVLTLPELRTKYGCQPSHLSRIDLLAAAHQAAGAPHPGLFTAGWYRWAGGRPPEVVAYGDYSAGELVAGWVQSLREHLRSGAFPDDVPRADLLGPLENPILTPEVWEVSREAFATLVVDFCDFVERRGHLPHDLGEPGARVGLGTFYRTFAEMYLAVADSGELPASISLRPFPRFPAVATALGHAYLDIADNELMRPDLNLYSVIKAAKLQTWTLKPARAI
jgi:hypothetical protein